MKAVINLQKHILIFALMVLVGCASTGTLKSTMLSDVKLSNFKTIVIHVSSQVPEASNEVIQLESLTITKLREKGLFEKVIAGSASPDAQADLKIDVEITKLKKVTAAARAMLGALAGRGGVVLNAKLIDLNTEEIISTFEAEGKSSGGSIFAGTTNQAIEQAASQIVEYVQGNM